MIIDKINDKDWDDFVLSHPFGNIYQTSFMYEVYKNTKNYDPIKLFAIDEVTNEIKGVLSAVVIREKEGILGHFSIHSIIQGGPLISANSSDVLSEILVEYDKLARKKSPFTEIKNLSDQSFLFKNLKSYIYEDHLNFLIDLNQSEKELWKQIQKPRRKNINRAISDGIVIEEINNKKMIPIFYRLLQDTYNNAKIPLSDTSLFESAFDNLMPKNLVKFFLAKYNDIYIGARAILTYKNCIYDWYAGASKDALSRYPNDYLVWHILKWGIENNYAIFDFGGAGKPNEKYGPREFKRRFGGQVVNFGKYIKIHSPIKTAIANIGFKIYRRII